MRKWRFSFFHHTRDAIEAHLTIVMAALAITRHRYEKTGITAKKIVATLKSIQTQTILYKGYQIESSEPITPKAQQILDALGH